MKKFLSVILALALALTVLPGVALAEEAPAPEYVAQLKKPGEEEPSGEKYTSIQAAVEAAEDGDTVVVLADHELDCVSYGTNSDGYATLVNVLKKTIMIDLNGMTVSINPLKANFSDAKSGMLFAAFATDDEGVLTLMDSSAEQRGTIKVTKEDGLIVYSLAACYSADGQLNITSGNYWMNASTDGRGMIYDNNGDFETNNVVISGGNFYLGNVAYASPWIFNVSGNNEGHILVSGGTFNANILNQSRVLEVDQPYNKALKDNGDGTWSMVDAVAWVNNHNSDGTDHWDDGDGLSTIEDAVNKANYNNAALNCENCGENIITLLTDVTVSSMLTIGENMTIAVDGAAPTIPTVYWYGTGPIFNIAPQKTLKIVSGFYSSNVTEWCPEGYAAVEIQDGLFEVMEGYKLKYTIPANENEIVYLEGVAKDGDGKAKGHTHAHPTEDKAIFDWYKTVNGNNLENPVDFDKDTFTEEAAIYGTYEPAVVVRFDSKGGTNVPSQAFVPIVAGVTVTEPTAPTKSNYTFDGWYTEETFENEFEFVDGKKDILSSVMLYAKWLENHTVSFVTNGGSAVADAIVADGKTLPPLDDPERSGYTFGGWYTDSGLISAYDFTAPVTEPFTLYAKWIPKHTVSFVSNEGSEVGPVEVPDGALLTAPTPTRAGYTFAGWYTDETLETAYDYETAVTGDFTLYAKWNVIVYAPAYTVDAPAGVLLNPANPLPGMTVNVTVADIGADGVRVVDAKGNPVRVNVKDGAFSFVMPYGDVDIVPFEVPFTDVAETDYFTEAMLWALANDITEGTSETTFSPEAPCTRAEMVTFLWRAAGCPAPAGAESAFSDIDPEAYYATALLWAEEQGITAGSGDGAFSPNAACDRAQMAVFLQRMAKGKAVSTENSFDDVAADAYYANAVQWALEQGITAGTGEGTYSPDAVCTRAQMVTFLWRACSK